jgi:hypothetical protein
MRNLSSIFNFKRSSCTVLFALSLGMGLTCIRAHTAFNRGLVYFDEAYYLLEAKTFHRALEEAPALLSGRLPLSEFKKQLIEEGTLFPPGKATPIHCLMLVLFSLLPIPLTVVGSLVSLSATLFVWHALEPGARALGLQKEEAVLLSLLLIASPYMSFYGLSTGPHSWACVFLLFALSAFLTDQWGRAGLFLGLSLTTHYGMLPCVLLVITWAGLMLLMSEQPRSLKIQQGMRGGLAFLAPALLLEIIYQLVKWKYAAYWADISYRTYFGQLLTMIQKNSPGDVPFLTAVRRNWGIFEAILKTQGILLNMFMFGSLMFLWARIHSLDLRARGVLLLVTSLVAFWIFNPGYMGARAIMFMLPFLFIGLACAIVQAQTLHLHARVILQYVLGIFVVISTIHSWQMDRWLRSPYGEAADYLVQSGYQGPIVDPSNMLIWQYYLGRRVDYDKGAAPRFPGFKSTVLKRLDTWPGSKKMAFFIRTQWPATEYDPLFGVFLKRITQSRSPIKSWRIPLAHLDLYRYDIGYADLAQEEDLNLYWITKNDVLEIGR